MLGLGCVRVRVCYGVLRLGCVTGLECVRIRVMVC